MKLMKMALVEIDKTGEGRKISNLEKNRLALKFIEMNASPHRFHFFKRFTDDYVKKVKLNLR